MATGRAQGARARAAAGKTVAKPSPARRASAAPAAAAGLASVTWDTEPPKEKSSVLPLLCLVGSVAVVVGIVWAKNRSAEATRDAFSSIVKASVAWKDLPRAEWKDHPYRRGKVLFVDKAAGVVDDIQFDSRVGLAYERWEDFRATKPEEVKTIVLLEYTQEKVGRYTDGADALRWTAKVTVIDGTIPAVVDATEIVGHEPQLLKTHREAASGAKPDVQVLKYLQERFVPR